MPKCLYLFYEVKYDATNRRENLLDRQTKEETISDDTEWEKFLLHIDHPSSQWVYNKVKL